MLIEIPNENSIVKWKNADEDEWKVAEISDLIKAYERPQGEWIPIRLLMEDNYHSHLSFRCNQCRYVEGYRAKYCAGCGAFMRAEDGG